MIQSLRSFYAGIPHGLLTDAIIALLILAALIGVVEMLKERLHIRNYENTPLRAALYERASRHYGLLVVIVVLVFGTSFGFGFGRAIASGDSNLVAYCNGSTCIQRYHNACSDWDEYQHDNK